MPHVGLGLPLLLCLSCDRFYINQMYFLSIADLYIFYWSFIKLIHFIYNLFNFQVLYRVILKNMIFIKVFWFKWIFWFIESFSGILVLKWLIGVKSTEIVQIWSLNYVKWFSIFNWSYDLKKKMAIEMRQDLSSCSSDIRWTIIFTIYHFHSTLVVFIIGFSSTHLQISHWLDSEASSNSRG